MGIFDGVGGGLMAAGAVPSPASPFLLAAGIGASLFGSLFGAHEQASAASDAADKQSAAAKYAADLQDAANKRAEAFTRQQAENDWRNQELTRKQNYGQYVAQRHGWGTFGAMLGLPAPEVPDYQASIDPGFDNGGGTPASGAPSVSASGGSDPVTQALLDNYKSLGVQPTGPGSGPTDIAYFTKQAKDSLAAGERPLSYWLGPNGRVAQELAKAKGGSAGGAAPAMAPPATGTLARIVQPYRVANPTAALNPYTTGTLARML